MNGDIHDQIKDDSPRRDAGQICFPRPSAGLAHAFLGLFIRYSCPPAFGIGFCPKREPLFVLISNRCLSYGRKGRLATYHE
ncbi:MAG: hypothetical protein ACXWUD_11540, partial [Methylosarcina sp.]